MIDVSNAWIIETYLEAAKSRIVVPSATSVVKRVQRVLCTELKEKPELIKHVPG